ncbi:putative Ig domain-containing protein [candidate division KSB1 bacterium]|nr:putative Ig domain-containing protein [candidate division KSB1 bacterium]
MQFCTFFRVRQLSPCVLIALVLTPFRLISQSTLYYNQPLVVATGEQTSPILVNDNKAGIFVIWQDNRDGRPVIYAQHLNNLSQPTWKPDGIVVAVSAKGQSAPAAIGDGQGGVLIFWQDSRNDDGDIFGQHLDGEGNLLWGASGAPVIRANGKQAEPLAASDGQGGAFVLCRDFRSGSEDVVAQQIGGDGRVFLDAAGKALAQGLGAQILGDVAATADGGFIVAWSDNLTRTLRVLMQRYDAKANPQWLANVSVGSVLGAQTAPKVHVPASVNDTPGSTYVVWVDNRSSNLDLYAQKIDGNGLPQWGLLGVAICKASGNQYDQQIVSDGGDGLLLVWEDKRSGNTDVYGQAVNAAGQVRWKAGGVAIAVAGQEQIQPCAAADGSGGLICAWSDDRGTGTNILAQRLDKTGKALWAANGLYVTNADGIKRRPALAAFPGNSLGAMTLVAWDDTRYGTADIFVQALKADGTLANVPPQITSKPDTVATEDQLYSYKIVATDPDSDDVLTLALETEATWLKLTNDGAIAGTPANEHVGNYTVTVRVTDKRGAATMQKFSLRVNNVNDPPFFTSVPDTNAYVDSLYVYRAVAGDADRGDVVQILKPVAPEWLSWDGSTLQGKPSWQHAGMAYAVSLLARDAFGATATQTFQLRVIDLGAPDTTAPPAPQALQIHPANWSADKKFILLWKNPVDPSRIAGAFYKIGTPPAHARDGVFVPFSDEPATAQLELTAPREGKWPVYLWLLDGRNNADHRTAVQIAYRYDATPPKPQQLLYPNQHWSRGDSVRFQWTPASDTTSGVRRYHFFLDDKFFRYLTGDADNFLFILQLAERNYSWALMAEDSAGNLGARNTATFAVDRRPPDLFHAAIDTADARNALDFAAQSQDARSGIEEVRLYYRAAGGQEFHVKSLQATPTQFPRATTFLPRAKTYSAGTFSTRLEAAEVASKGLEYYLETADSAGNRAAWPAGAPRQFQAVIVASPNVVAPAPLATGRYQIFSIPYNLQNGSPAAVLEDDLGSYDPTTWRLFDYQPGEGNVEFGKPGFDVFAPGHAYWLITTSPKLYSTGTAHSISTNATFPLALQPGWNLIATPFDFPTAWSAVQLPDGVENNLWAFDGMRYSSQREDLQPWQGYFLRNLDSLTKTILIAPVVAGNNAAMQKPIDSEILWQVQLRVSDGEFRDDENHLGAAAAAAETWDRLDLSEPPAIGDYVSLHFDRSDWPRYAGLFTSDFRPANDAAQKWDFTVVATRAGLPVELTWEYSGDLPSDWFFVLEDVDGRRRRRIKPAKNSTTPARYIFNATPQARRFIWWAGPEQQLSDAGALKNIFPAAFELAPSYPNPLRLAGASTMGTIRFGLPTTAAVRLTIFDLSGRLVRTLVAGQSLDAGYHEAQWDGADEQGRSAAAGIYIYRLEAANFITSRKLILLR